MALNWVKLLLFKKNETSQNSRDRRLALLINVCGRETVNALGKRMLRNRLKEEEEMF